MFTVGKKSQLTLNFEAGMVDAYNTCREFVQARVHQLGKPLKWVAAEMDYSPSDLSRKLSQNDNDSRRFTLDDLETYMQKTGDVDPVLYLVEKYLTATDKEKQRAELLAKLAELDKQIGDAA